MSLCTTQHVSKSVNVTLCVISLRWKTFFTFIKVIRIVSNTSDHSFRFHFFLSSLFLSGNTHPPALQVNGSLLVPLSGISPLAPSLLQVRDPDSPSERLVFQLVQIPSNGELVLFRGEEGEGKEGRDLTRDDTFTWAELRTGRVRFRHQRDKARSVDRILPRFMELGNVYEEPKNCYNLIVNNQFFNRRVRTSFQSCFLAVKSKKKQTEFIRQKTQLVPPEKPGIHCKKMS